MGDSKSKSGLWHTFMRVLDWFDYIDQFFYGFVVSCVVVLIIRFSFFDKVISDWYALVFGVGVWGLLGAVGWMYVARRISRAIDRRIAMEASKKSDHDSNNY